MRGPISVPSDSFNTLVERLEGARWGVRHHGTRSGQVRLVQEDEPHPVATKSRVVESVQDETPETCREEELHVPFPPSRPLRGRKQILQPPVRQVAVRAELGVRPCPETGGFGAIWTTTSSSATDGDPPDKPPKTPTAVTRHKKWRCRLTVATRVRTRARRRSARAREKGRPSGAAATASPAWVRRQRTARPVVGSRSK